MKHYKNKGFTIIESLIFLAVSGALFLSVAIMISGQTARYQARDAINQVESVVRNVFNDVGNGYYPLIGKKYNCSAGATAPSVTQTATAGENRGTKTGDAGCIIAGKSIKFEQDKIVIDTLVANGDLVDAPTNPTVELVAVTGLSEAKYYKWGLKNNNSTRTFYVLYTKFAPTYIAGEFASGSQSIALYEFTSPPATMRLVSSQGATPNNKICFENGGKDNSLVIKDYSLEIEADYNGEGC